MIALCKVETEARVHEVPTARGGARISARSGCKGHLSSRWNPCRFSGREEALRCPPCPLEHIIWYLVKAHKVTQVGAS